MSDLSLILAFALFLLLVVAGCEIHDRVKHPDGY